jgi:uncharacterized protein YjbI with pentapeptide repeats
MGSQERRFSARVEAPRVGDELTKLRDDEWADGAVLEDVSWSGGAPEAGASEVELAGSRLSSVRFTGLEVDQLRMVDVVVDDCELSGVTLSAGRWERVELTRCRMSGLVAPGLRATHVSLVDCKLDGAWLRGASLDRCEFVDCDLGAADLYGARFSRCRLLRCRLDGAELSSATFDEVALHGSSIDGIRGADALRGIIIGSDQVVPLAVSIFGPLGITIDDDYGEYGDRAG